MLLNNRALSYAQEHANWTEDLPRAILFIMKSESKWSVGTAGSIHVEGACHRPQGRLAMAQARQPVRFGIYFFIVLKLVDSTI